MCWVELRRRDHLCSSPIQPNPQPSVTNFPLHDTMPITSVNTHSLFTLSCNIASLHILSNYSQHPNPNPLQCPIATAELQGLLDRSRPVRSSMLTGLMSTMLKLWSLTSRFQRFILKSSAEMYVSQSLHIGHNKHLRFLIPNCASPLLP